MDEFNQEIKAKLNMLNYVDANRWKWSFTEGIGYGNLSLGKIKID